MRGVRTYVRDDVLVCRLPEEIDAMDAGTAKHEIEAALEPGLAGLVVDLSRVRYLDSSGVSMLFGLLRGVETTRHRMVLFVPRDSPIRRLLRVTNLDASVELLDDLDASVAAAARSDA